MNEQLKQAINEEYSISSSDNSLQIQVQYSKRFAVKLALSDPSILRHCDPEIMKQAGWESSEWISVKDRLPECLQTVWISNGKGLTTLGCRSDYFNGDNEDLIWSWCVTNGVIYEENGEIVSECEADDLDVKYWKPIPQPPKQ